MPSLFVPAVPEYVPVCDQLDHRDGVEKRPHRTHVEYVFDKELIIDRKATGLRHALWYSCIGGLRDAHVAQYDKTQLKLVAVDG